MPRDPRKTGFQSGGCAAPKASSPTRGKRMDPSVEVRLCGRCSGSIVQLNDGEPWLFHRAAHLPASRVPDAPPAVRRHRHQRRRSLGAATAVRPPSGSPPHRRRNQRNRGPGRRRGRRGNGTGTCRRAHPNCRPMSRLNLSPTVKSVEWPTFGDRSRFRPRSREIANRSFPPDE